MDTVEDTLTPLTANVRTARLVATAVARRSGVAESLLDEVRLAVGEACSRAVEAHRLHCPAEPVRLALTDQPGRFEVQVTDTGRVGPGDAGAAEPSDAEAGPQPPAAPPGGRAGHRDGFQPDLGVRRGRRRPDGPAGGVVAGPPGAGGGPGHGEDAGDRGRGAGRRGGLPAAAVQDDRCFRRADLLRPAAAA